jgi:hypothetical protein
MIRRLRTWRERVTGVSRNHPFLLSLVVMLLVVIPGFIRIQSITDDLHRQQVGSCQSGNDARKNQIDLWSFIISLSSDPAQTPLQKQRVAALETQLHHIFAPRPCP